jgi:hypothetical protein
MAVMADFVRLNRTFRIASFSSYHRQLILQSDAASDEGTTTRVEIYFGHADITYLRASYHGLHIRVPRPAERVELGERFGLADAELADLYLLAPGLLDGFVVSGRPSWREAERSIDDPTLFDFSLERLPEGMTSGQVS